MKEQARVSSGTATVQVDEIVRQTHEALAAANLAFPECS
jgi:hypothetical protein